ncbi:hypothetical protein RRG08_024570 [Elysia crispata]|uniref:Uncharacterized protein n=1 Tax=Elysia crispata TaxID=231223 RepID=A0AAE0ZWU8_9GAST|nr:hypothetical protein RRG08_024570 [Elysia crispata]
MCRLNMEKPFSGSSELMIYGRAIGETDNPASLLHSITLPVKVADWGIVDKDSRVRKKESNRGADTSVNIGDRRREERGGERTRAL